MFQHAAAVEKAIKALLTAGRGCSPAPGLTLRLHAPAGAGVQVSRHA